MHSINHMLMKTLLSGILFFLVICAHGQEYEKAIVTDLNFLRRSSATVRPEYFPFYFQHKAFARDVQQDIASLLTQKYNLKEVFFLEPDSILYVESTFAPRTEAKDFAKLTPRDKTIYVAVETIIQEFQSVNDQLVYRFTTRVNIFNNRGKSIYKFKSHIPFISVLGDEIAGEVIMGEEDFYTFYFDGLYNAFEGKYSTVSNRYVSKPMAGEYLKFTSQAEKFYLTTTETGYSYGQAADNQVEVVKFTINHWENTANNFDFNNLVTVGFLEEGYHFINQLNKTEYVTRLKGGVETLKKITDVEADINFQLLKADGKHVGYFTMDNDNNLSGRHAVYNFIIKFREAYFASEVFIDEELVALINHFEGQKVFFLAPEITRKQLTALINLMFVYDYSSALRQKMVRAYD
jgi:hypothetical protein